MAEICRLLRRWAVNGVDVETLKKCFILSAQNDSSVECWERRNMKRPRSRSHRITSDTLRDNSQDKAIDGGAIKYLQVLHLRILTEFCLMLADMD